MIVKRTDNGKFPLVLLHGWGLNSGVWDLILAPLEAQFDVHRIDLPGFGHNHDKAPEQYQLDELVRLVAPLCPDGALVAGWSLGGLLAGRLAMLYRQKVAALFLIASAPCFIEQPQWKGIKPQVLNQFCDDLQKDSSKTIERFMAIQAIGSETARQDVKQLKQAVFNYPQPAQSALAGGLEILQATDLREDLKALLMPIRGIYGRLDSLVAAKSVEAMAPTLNNFAFELIGKASHAPFISHPEAFLQHFFAMYQDLRLSI